MKKIALVVLFSLLLSIIFVSGCVYKVPEDPNTFVRTMMHDNLTRTYRIHIPKNFSNSTSSPLVLVLHGGGGTGEGMERTLTLGEFNILSDTNPFLVVYPDGIDKHWNDGRNDTNDTAHQQNIDDVGFLTSLVHNLCLEFNIDQNKIFATGISNGAMMSYRLAMEQPNLFAAIAPVAGAIPTDLVSINMSEEPVSICILSGTKDPLVPWDGGMVGTPRNPRGTVISVPDSVQYWMTHNNCTSIPNSTYLPDIDPRDRTRVQRHVYTDGRNNTEVVLYEIMNGGHTWPDGYQYLPVFLIGRTTHDVNANIIIWEFFSTHPKQ